MVKTFLELMEIDSVVGGLYAADPSLKETKFGYAYTKFYKKNYEPTLKELQEELMMAQIEHALEDEKTKALVRDEKNPRGYAYSKQGSKDVYLAEKKIREAYEVKEIEIEPYLAAYVPELNEAQKEILTGTVI